MVALTKIEIFDELTKLGIYTPSELRALFREYKHYFSHGYVEIISPHE